MNTANTGHVVVTGASGMLGGHLVRRLLDDGHRVHGVDLLPAVHSHPRLTHSQGDIRDTALLSRLFAGADAAVHCAAALPSYPAEMIRSIIVDGANAVLTAARQVSLPRLVHISSTAVYGLPRVVPTPEDHPREPVDPYTQAKTDAEVLVERFRADGLCVPVLRPKTFLGPGRMGLFAMLFEWAEEGRHFPVLGRGEVRIQMFAIEDLVDAVTVVLAAPDDVANDTYNLAAAEFGTLREDFQSVLDAAGHGRRVIGLPARPALAALAALEWTRLSPVYGRLLHKLLADSYVDISKARRRLGFQPRLSNRDAILNTYRWWQRSRSTTPAASEGRTSSEPWRQGALTLAKIFF